MTTQEENRVNDFIQALAAQRNLALDQAAQFHADLMLANRQIVELKNTLEKLTKD